MFSFNEKSVHEFLHKFIVLGGLLVIGLGVVVFYPANNSSLATDFKDEEDKILAVLGDYIRSASDVEVYPGGAKLYYDEADNQALFILEERGVLSLVDSLGNRFTISSPEVEVSRLEFRKVANEGGVSQVETSFMISSARNNKQAGSLRAAIFDSHILPVTGSQIELGIESGDISSINGIVYFLGGTNNVGIGTSTPTQRLHIDSGGLRITNPTNSFPGPGGECNLDLRGTIWITQPGGGGASDQFAVCIRDAEGDYRWAQYTGL